MPISGMYIYIYIYIYIYRYNICCTFITRECTKDFKDSTIDFKDSTKKKNLVVWEISTIMNMPDSEIFSNYHS